MAEFSVADNCFSNTLTNQNFKETLFRVVPNPVSKEIRIVNNDYKGDIDFELYDLNSKLVRRRGRIYIINKKNPKYKARQR